MNDVSVGDIVKVEGYNKYATFRVTAISENDHIAQLVEVRQWGEPNPVQKSWSRLIKVCPEVVHEPGRGISWHVCGRRIKDEGLCGLHLSARTRAKEKQTKQTESWRVRVEKTNEMRAEIERRGLQDRVNIWDTDKGLVLVKLDDLLDMLRNA